METHTFKIDLLFRGQAQIENSVLELPLAIPVSVTEKQFLEKVVLFNTPLFTIPLTVTNPKYLFMYGIFLQDDLQNNIKTGDFAPFVYRINGAPVDSGVNSVLIYGGAFGSLQIAGPNPLYTGPSQIQLSMFIGG